jgi:hypothetical protein
LFSLERLSPVFVGLGNAYIFAPLCPQLDVAIELGGVVGIDPLLFDDRQRILRNFGCVDSACGEGLVVLMDKEINIFVFRFCDEVYDLLYLGELRVVDVLGEVEGLASMLDLELASSNVSCTIKFDLEIVH